MFVICLKTMIWSHVFVLQVVKRKFQQECDIAVPITFDGDHIALDIPNEGVHTGNGWDILPFYTPCVSSQEPIATKYTY